MSNISGIITQRVNGLIVQESMTVAIVGTGITINNFSGGGGGSVTQPFSSPATMWQVLHNRGYRPLVEIMDQFGELMYPTVSHVSVNEFRVYFFAPTRGSVIYY